VISFSKGAVVLESSRYPFCYNYDPTNREGPHSMASILPYLPFSQDLNRLILTVRHLDAPHANVTWGGQTRSFTRAELAQGINLTAEFSQTPFDDAFTRVMQAVADQQEFENYMIKGTSNYNGNDNGGNFDSNMIAIDAEKQAEVKAAIVPVRYSIVITPAGTPEAAAPAIPAPPITLPRPDRPVITSPDATAGAVGSPFTYQIIATNSPTNYFATSPSARGVVPPASSLPAGIGYDMTTGLLSGTPRTAGIFPIQIAAMNESGVTTKVITLTVGGK
jgi:hypothetical protein